MSLSAKNGWIDKNGRVYIIFTIDEAKMALNCAEQKAIKLLSELEKKAGLIERKRQGLGKPNLIYVKNFISAVDPHLLEIERTAQGRVDTMLPHMMEAAGVTEELKACDPMRWVGLMNTLTAQIEEILIRELICS